MATAYSTLLGLALPVQGELSGSWGNEVNNYITNYLDASVAGTQTLTTDADVTLTKTTGASLGATSSQYAVINCTGARTAQRNITAPAQSKVYTVINATTGGFAVVIRGAGPTTGVTIAAGESAQVAWNGSDFIKVSNTNGAGTFTNLTASGPVTFTGNQIISVTDNTNAALRITQLGTGNALLVEDSANPDSTPFVIDSAGNVGIGTSSPATKLNVYDSTSSVVSVDGDTGTNIRASLYSTNNSGASLNYRKARGTLASPAAVATGDFVLSNQNFAYDGSTFRAISGISSAVENYTGSDNVSGYIRFDTRPSGAAATSQERMRIDSAGNVLVGTTTSPAGSKELVLGGDYIEGVVTIGNTGTAQTISLANGTLQTATLTGNCTFTMPTAVAGKSFTLILSTGSGSFTATFTSVKWPNNTAPTITTTASRWDILTFVSNGTSWYGNFAQAYQ
jgi:hypothetical protein